VVVGELGQDRRLIGTSALANGVDGTNGMDEAHRASGQGLTVVDALMASSGLVLSEARSLLAKFGLGADTATRPPSSLSPGERTRAELAAFAASGVNFLVLDEPTNHLDLPAIEQLESALEQFDGTLLLVSHDRRLLEQVTVGRRLELGRDGMTETAL